MKAVTNLVFGKAGIKSEYHRMDSRRIIFLVLLFMLALKLHGQDDASVVPISNLFHNIGGNILGAVTHNYGLNFIGAAGATSIFVETGWDWAWRTGPYHSAWLADSGRPGLYIGYIIPAVAPVITYITGRSLKDVKLQITGLALAQTVLLTIAIQSPLKMITGRALPGIVTDIDHTRSTRTGDFSGEFDWFNMNPIGGWPSSHTASAFAAAAAVTEIYKDSLVLKILSYTYAALIGFGVTLNVHWASDAVAGALIGYAIGKTVGHDFSGLLRNTRQKNAVSFYCTPVSAGVRITFRP
jgi:membrane-associated phospholipid phosphatase